MSYQQRDRDRNFQQRRGGDFSRDHRENREQRERNSNGR